MTVSFRVSHFFSRLWRNPVIVNAMRDEYGPFADKLLWAMKEGLLDIDPGDVPEFLTQLVLRSSHEIDTLFGQSENGDVFPIQIMEFDHIYFARVNGINHGFFSSKTAAKSYVTNKYREAMEAHREVKRLKATQEEPEPDYLEFWMEFRRVFRERVTNCDEPTQGTIKKTA